MTVDLTDEEAEAQYDAQDEEMRKTLRGHFYDPPSLMEIVVANYLDWERHYASCGMQGSPRRITGSTEWRALRWAVDDCHRAWKELVGADAGPVQRDPIPNALRKQVLERDAYRCQACDDWHDLAIDHVIPLAKGGGTRFHNLQVLCRPCNLAKGSR